MDRNQKLTEKAVSLQSELLVWATQNDLLKPGEKLLVSIDLSGSPVAPEVQVKINDEALLNTPIDDLDLSRRAYNALHDAGCRTIGDVIRLDRPPHHTLRNFGATSLWELRKTLKDFLVPLPAHWRL